MKADDEILTVLNFRGCPRCGYAVITDPGIMDKYRESPCSFRCKCGYFKQGNDIYDLTKMLYDER